MDSSPLSEIPPSDLFGGVDISAWRWLNLTGREVCPFLADCLPSLPPETVQLELTSSSGQDALRWGFETYELLTRLLREHGHRLAPSDVVLDFGCGWGRLIRFFTRDIAPENLWGIDIEGLAVEACRSTNRWARFKQTDPLPPSGFDEGTFTLVYAYSVFSHLSEEAHLAWLEEFERILQPRGFFISTTLPRRFIEECGEFAQKDPETLTPWQSGMARCFLPSDEFLSAYDKAEYCFDSPPGTEHYGNACIPKEYVLRHWSRFFEVLDYFPTRLGQPVIFCRKR